MKKLVFVLGFIFPICVQAETSGYCGPKDDDGNWGTNCEWVYDEASKTLTVSGQGQMYSTNGLYDHPWSKGTSFYGDIENIVIENGITDLGVHAFYGASSVKNISLPDSLEVIRLQSLKNTSLSSIVIPENVTSIHATSEWPLPSSLTSFYCSPNRENICRQALEASELDSTKVLKIYEKDGDEYYVDGRFYEKPQDIGTSNYIKKRIYTIDEANKVAGDKNMVKIKYR